MEPNTISQTETTPGAAGISPSATGTPPAATEGTSGIVASTAKITKPSAETSRAAAEITPEILMVMSASIAAYLGKTVRIRRVRFIDPHHANSWGQASRVVLQSSHILRRDHS